MKKIKLTNRQVEKAGIGLVIWQLSRRGLEVQQTSDSSSQGDLWAKFPDLPMLRIEVKASSSRAFHIRPSQHKRCDIYILVSIHYARCWLFTADEMRREAVLHSKHDDGTLVVDSDKFPVETADAWHLLTEPAEASLKLKRERKIAARLADAPKTKSGAPRAPRTVKRTLADGTQKTYEYPAYSSAVNGIQKL